MGTRMIHRSCVDGGKRGDHIDGKECAISSVVYQTTKYLSSFYFSLWQKGTKGGRWWAVGAQHFADGVDQEERTRMMMMVGSSTDYISLASVGWCYTGLGFFS